MIELVNIHKAFGDQKVLNGLNFEAQQGEITVIIGRSGEGKSVLLKHLIGLMKPDEGQILIDGVDLASLEDIDLYEIRKKFGLLFQHSALFDSMNVYENIEFPMIEHAHWGIKKRKDRIHELVELVGLKDNVLAKFPSELSGGMRKRVGLARAIALNPEILLYDEPTTGLDPIMTDVIDQLILNTQKKLGITSVVISHDMQAVFSIADKIAMLYEGQIRHEGTVSDFRNTTDQVIKNFLEGKATEDQHKEL